MTTRGRQRRGCCRPGDTSVDRASRFDNTMNATAVAATASGASPAVEPGQQAALPRKPYCACHARMLPMTLMITRNSRWGVAWLEEAETSATHPRGSRSSDNGPLSRVPVVAFLAALPDAIIMYSLVMAVHGSGRPRAAPKGQPSSLTQHRIKKLRLHPGSLCVRDTRLQNLQVAPSPFRCSPGADARAVGARSWLRDDHRRPARGRPKPVTLRLRWHDPELG